MTGSFINLTLKANSPQTFHRAGRYFVVFSTSLPFNVAFNGQHPFEGCITGFSFPMPNGQFFDRLLLYNPNASDLAVTFYIGDSLASFLLTVLKNAPTKLLGSDSQTLASGAAAVVYSGVNSGLQRKQIIVHNTCGFGPLLVLGEDGKVAGIVNGNSAWTADITGKVSIQNLSGNPIDYVVGETFYL